MFRQHGLRTVAGYPNRSRKPKPGLAYPETRGRSGCPGAGLSGSLNLTVVP